MRTETRASMHSLRLEPRREWEPILPVLNAFLPTTATVLLKQHAGQSSRRVVNEGDKVREGMVLGVPEGELSTYVHAPIPGTVRSIGTVRLPEGGECESVEILLEGSFDRLGKRPERYVWKGMRRADLLHTLREKGVVETVGGKPIDDILASAPKGCEIILPALDSEPYIKTESAIFATKSREVLEAARLVADLLESPRIWLLLDSELPQVPAIDASLAEFRSAGGPGLELLRISALNRGKDWGGGREMQAGTPRLKLLPSTLIAVFEAVVEAKTFVERYLTVAGAAIRSPAVLKARIGTPIGDLIEECGGFVESPERLVLGGPLTGLAARDLDMPVTKTMGGVLALIPPETRRGRLRPCIRCGLCREYCPVGIDPETIFRDLSGARIENAKARGLESCVSCGICSYVCPSRIELSQSFAARIGVSR